MDAMGAGRTVVFLPCRAGSVRVKDKNTRPFAGRPDGLLSIKLSQLEKLDDVSAVVLDSNDARVLEYGHRRQRDWRSTGVELVVVERPNELGQSSTTTDSLIHYALRTVECDTLIWTHVTSPFFDERHYREGLDRYRRRDSETHDSVMSVCRLQGFYWNDRGPFNYSSTPVRWPRTQDLPPIFEVNSAMFVVAAELGRKVGDRIGDRPLMFEVPPDVGFDIDDEDDFELAEAMHEMRGKHGGATTNAGVPR